MRISAVICVRFVLWESTGGFIELLEFPVTERAVWYLARTRPSHLASRCADFAETMPFTWTIRFIEVEGKEN